MSMIAFHLFPPPSFETNAPEIFLAISTNLATYSPYKADIAMAMGSQIHWRAEQIHFNINPVFSRKARVQLSCAGMEDRNLRARPFSVGDFVFGGYVRRFA